MLTSAAADEHGTHGTHNILRESLAFGQPLEFAGQRKILGQKMTAATLLNQAAGPVVAELPELRRPWRSARSPATSAQTS
jgi:hypothetical protein